MFSYLEERTTDSALELRHHLAPWDEPAFHGATPLSSRLLLKVSQCRRTQLLRWARFLYLALTITGVYSALCSRQHSMITQQFIPWLPKLFDHAHT